MRERIINERRIELAFEGHRYFDIRRWLIADQVETTPIRGMVIRDLATDEKTYDPNLVLLRKGAYQDRMNLLPIATDEIQRNPDLAQTPGW